MSRFMDWLLNIKRAKKIEEPFVIQVSYPVGFSTNDRYLRLNVKEGYRIMRCNESASLFDGNRWSDMGQTLILSIQDIAYHNSLNKQVDNILEREAR